MSDKPGTNEPRYNPATCITADELRAMNIPVPDRVPGCGWMPRRAMKWRAGVPGHSKEDIAQGILNVSMEVTFTEPFRWVTATMEIENPGGVVDE